MDEIEQPAIGDERQRRRRRLGAALGAARHMRADSAAGKRFRGAGDGVETNARRSPSPANIPARRDRRRWRDARRRRSTMNPSARAAAAMRAACSSDRVGAKIARQGVSRNSVAPSSEMASASSANSPAKNRPNGAAKPAKKFLPTRRAPSKSDERALTTGRAVWFGRQPRGSQQRVRAHRVDQGAHPTQFERPPGAQFDEGARQRDRGVDRRSRRRDDGLVARAVEDDGKLSAARLESNIGVDIAKAGRRAVVDEKQEFARQRFQRLIFGDGSREPRGDFIGVGTKRRPRAETPRC